MLQEFLKLMENIKLRETPFCDPFDPNLVGDVMTFTKPLTDPGNTQITIEVLRTGDAFKYTVLPEAGLMCFQFVATML